MLDYVLPALLSFLLMCKEIDTITNTNIVNIAEIG